MNTFHRNDILIDQTMICEASRLLARYPAASEYIDLVYERERLARHLNIVNWPDPQRYPHAGMEPGYSGWYTSLDQTPEGVIAHNLVLWPPTNTERLVQLSLLLDALALHEKTYVLKGELPADAPYLELRNILIAGGIVIELDTDPLAESIKQDFETLFSVVLETGTNSDIAYDEAIAFRVINIIVNLLKNEPPSERDKGIWKWLSQLYDSNYHFAITPDRLLISENPFIEYARELIHEISGLPYTRLSGSELGGISNLRTLMYSRLSERAGIVVYPSLRRIPFFEVLDNREEKRIAEVVYAALAEAFESNIGEIYSDGRHFPIYLPPTLAVFLETYEKVADLAAAIEKFREVFAECRRSFRELEEELANTPDFKRRSRLKRRITEATKAVKYHYKDEGDSFLRSAISFAPDIISPIVNPTDPRSYSTNLLLKPIDWIKKWWVKRPLKHVFRLRDRINNAIKYEDWASGVLGVKFDEKEREDFCTKYKRYLRDWDSPEELTNTNR